MWIKVLTTYTVKNKSQNDPCQNLIERNQNLITRSSTEFKVTGHVTPLVSLTFKNRVKTTLSKGLF